MNSNRFSRMALLLLSSLVMTTPPSADDLVDSRERAALAEEQAHLARKLKRLHQTMRVLADRLESEGRPRAVELLRDGISLLESREDTGDGSTLGERMQRSTEAIEEAQLVRSIESQQEVVQSLEKLLAVLMDRRSLESLEEEIAELRDLQAEANKLADAEAQLREDTQQLREDSANPAQKALDAGLKSALAQERQLLEQSESLGRSTGTLELEQLERALSRLAQDQRTDAEVLEAWAPKDTQEVATARELVGEAQAAERSAERLSQAAESLRAAARE